MQELLMYKFLNCLYILQSKFIHSFKCTYLYSYKLFIPEKIGNPGFIKGGNEEKIEIYLTIHPWV